MALIKSKQADALAHDAIVLDLGDLRRQANVLKERADAEAAAIIDRARQETEHIRVAATQRAAEAETLCEAAEKRGFEEGFARGHAEGLEAGRLAGHEEAFKQASEALEQLQTAWVEAADHWDNDRLRMLQEARQSMLTVAVRMAEKIVHRVPRVDPSIIEDQVAEAVRHIAQPQDATVRIHPEDRPIVEEALPSILNKLGATEHVHLADDPAIERGGCRVTAGQGVVDASLDAQLQRLVEAMLPVAGATPPAPPAGDADTDQPETPSPEEDTDT
ncbi:MAG: FliH/SctL family protein [Planctomycetota bacterium]|jgi:flagellar biosynthesis/type III secretory pathway protein FliH